MAAHSFSDLAQHVGHTVEVVTYGEPPVNASVECIDCYEALIYFDKEPSA